jgi:hypothetical protein
VSCTVYTDVSKTLGNIGRKEVVIGPSGSRGLYIHELNNCDVTLGFLYKYKRRY